MADMISLSRQNLSGMGRLAKTARHDVGKTKMSFNVEKPTRKSSNRCYVNCQR